MTSACRVFLPKLAPTRVDGDGFPGERMNYGDRDVALAEDNNI